MQKKLLHGYWVWAVKKCKKIRFSFECVIFRVGWQWMEIHLYATVFRKHDIHCDCRSVKESHWRYSVGWLVLSSNLLFFLLVTNSFSANAFVYSFCHNVNSSFNDLNGFECMPAFFHLIQLYKLTHGCAMCIYPSWWRYFDHAAGAAWFSFCNMDLWAHESRRCAGDVVLEWNLNEFA